MATTWTFEGTQRGYTNLWAKLTIKPGADSKSADKFANMIIKGERLYQRVEALTGVPWFFVGALHMRESSCSFAGVLHNGEKIIGKNKKTTKEPPGRGPFKTWEESAVDAIKLKGLHKIKEWPISRMGFEAERFNGIGYVLRGVNSPYVWAGSNLEQTGKYVADHVWDKDFDDPQIGVMTVLKRLSEMRPDIADRIEVKVPLPRINPVEAEMAAANLTVPLSQSSISNGAAVGGGAVTIASIANAVWEALKGAPDNLLAMLLAMIQQPAFLIALAGVGVFAFIWWKRKQMQITPGA